MEFHSNSLPQDVLVALLNHLSSRSLAVAACVSRSWKSAANAVNSTPRFFSALSLLPRLEDAMEDVLGEVLAAPFWPDFAIIFAGPTFKLSEISALVKRRLPGKMSLIACKSVGIAGRDFVTGEQIEAIGTATQVIQLKIMFGVEENGQKAEDGLVIVVGRFPGVQIKSLKLNDACSAEEVERFVVATSAVPHAGHGAVCPFAILLMGDPRTFLLPNTLLQALEEAYGGKTTIVGGLAEYEEDLEVGCLLAHSAVSSSPHEEKTSRLEAAPRCDFISLVFSEESRICASSDTSTQKIHCELAAAGGLRAVGPSYNVVSARDTEDMVTRGVSTEISFERDGLLMNVREVLEDIDAQINNVGHAPNHIGIFQKQKIFNQISGFAIHEVQSETNEEYLVVGGRGVKISDSFRFYQLDPVAARNTVHETLTSVARHVTCAMYTDDNHSNVPSYNPASASSVNKEVIGGILFGCGGRGTEFFGESNLESSIFQEKFPGISLAGMFGTGEFGPPAILPGTNDNDREVYMGKAIANFFSSMFVIFHT